MLDVNPAARRDEDFYATPGWMTRALLRRIFIPATASIIEPCAGDGAIVRELNDWRVLTNDIIARPPLNPLCMHDARSKKAWQVFDSFGPLGVCLTNPPFNDAFVIAEQAYEFCQIGVVLLLRLSWLEPTDDRGQWLKAHPPTRLIVMPRHDFRGNGKTDSVTSAWFVWDKAGWLCKQPGIDIVTKSERDVLMRVAEPRA